MMTAATPAQPGQRPNKARRTWALTAVALAVGLLIAGAAALMLGGAKPAQATTEGSQSSGAKVTQVLVAKNALKKGDTLSKENVAVRAIPSTFAPSLGLTPAAFAELEGKKMAFAVRPGEPLLKALLQRSDDDSFSKRVEVGRRALTIPVDEISSISGLLEPGDLIDLVAVNTRNQESQRAGVLLQSVRVMATGQKLAEDHKTGESRRFSTVTLDLSVEDAARLIAARESGKLTALLRNRTDTQRVAIAATPLATPPVAAPVPLVKPVVMAPTPKAPVEVPILYGSGGAGASALAQAARRN